MTVEKAIEILSDVGDINRCCAEDAEALDMAIKALEQQQRDCNTCKHSDNGNCAYTEECHECMWKSKYEQQSCEDCISRKAVKEQMIKYGFKAPDMTVTEFVEDCLPSVQPTRPTGKWIRDTITDLYHCSECRTIYHQDVKTMDNFCPNCGARMTESEDK